MFSESFHTEFARHEAVLRSLDKHMWSEPGVYLMQKTPYVVSIYREDFKCKVIEGSPLQWMRFRDVFDPDFKDKIRKRMAEIGKK